MSSWLVSLACMRRSVFRVRRGLKKYGLRSPGVFDSLFEAGPCRLIAEPGAQIVQQRRNLGVIHAAGKARHDRAALSLDGTNARQHDVGGVARIRGADGGRER